MTELSREEARERLDRAREAAGFRVHGPSLLAFVVSYVLVDLLFVRRWSLHDGALLVPLGALAGFSLLADWRGWDRSVPFRRAVVAVAVLLGIAGALLTGRIG